VNLITPELEFTLGVGSPTASSQKTPELPSPEGMDPDPQPASIGFISVAECIAERFSLPQQEAHPRLISGGCTSLVVDDSILSSALNPSLSRLVVFTPPTVTQSPQPLEGMVRS